MTFPSCRRFRSNGGSRNGDIVSITPHPKTATDMSTERSGALRLSKIIAGWVDSHAFDPAAHTDPNHIDWVRTVPFIGMHLACLAVIYVGWSLTAVAVAVALYFVRMFAVTGFYHRYFSHRAFKTSRALQFLFALLGTSAIQRGPLWWASHHRYHHAHSDRPQDQHSPQHHSFVWSHMGWFLSQANYRTRSERVRDLARYPELRFLDRFEILVPVLLAILLYVCGHLLERYASNLETNGLQLLIWGFVVSTVVLYHATFSINSVAHRFGSRRYPTRDNSRNNLWLALLTLGEGWHNNHHRYPGSVRQGFRWWELDVTYYLLRLLASCGLIWDLRPLPSELRHEHGVKRRAVDFHQRGQSL
jgi:stearoyl-CoA desaturase (delta-9 desaturase)